LWGLANVYRDQGRHAEAQPLYDRALSMYEEFSGPDAPKTVELKADYAELLRRMGQVDEKRLR
jgi:tetratricopeptide (TPR) repeat protein